MTTLANVFCALAIAAIPLHAGSIFINGDPPGDVGTGQGTPFSDTNNGITATFSSNDDAMFSSGFATASTTGDVSWGPEMLIAEDVGATLTIGFSQTLDSISMDFGTLTADPLDLVAYLGGTGGTQVFSTNATGTVVVPGGLAEGINFGLSGVNFDTVVLSNSSSAFPVIAAGNITVTADAPPVPEPSYFWMFPAIGLGLAIRKRRG